MRASFKRLGQISTVAFGLCACSSAFADDLYLTFTYHDVNLSASGWVDATTLSDGSATALQGLLVIPSGSLAGSYDLFANVNAPNAALSPFGAFIYDDTVYPSATGAMMNIDGLLFIGNGHEINVWGNGDGQPYSLWSSPGSGYDYSSNAGSFSLSDASGSQPTSIPSAGSLALLVMGGLAPVCRRTRRACSVA